MPIAVGDTLPQADLLKMGPDGPETVSLADHAKGKKLVVFAVPGAFTRTCTAAHMPSFIRTKDQFDAKGIDDVVCVSVNDPFVMQAWGESTGADEAGISMISDPNSNFTKAVGMDFDAPPVGFVSRSRRYAMIVEDGKVVTLHVEQGPGVCDVTAGESLLAEL